MIQFQRIKIQDFMSIENIEFEYKNGIHSIVGKNGSGKTQILISLLQGLYNKNIKSDTDKIQETYNKITEKPYTIEIEFVKDEKFYKIINDRKRNKIEIYENEKNITPKSIKAQLTKIIEVIGMDYNVFSAFYYLSINTLKSVFDITNEENLVYKFFDIDTIKTVEKKLKALLKDYKNEISIIKASLKSIDNQIETLTSFTKIDKEKLLNKKLILQETLLTLENSDDVKKIDLLKSQIDSLDKKINTLKTEYLTLNSTKDLLKKQLKQFEEGICPVCKSDVTNKSTDLKNDLNEIQTKQNKIFEKKEELLDKKQAIEEYYKKLSINYQTKKESLEAEINHINSQILLYEKEEDKYKRLSENLEILEEQKKQLITNYKALKAKINFVTVALSIIKSNAITKEYLNNFIILLNNKIKELKEFLNFKIDIFVKEQRGKIFFSFYDNDIEKTINSLSSGEKTRVALIVLFATLETLQILSQNKINILVLDELLGVLDEEGIEMLKLLLNKYREDLAIYVVLHHNEIEKSFFDSTIKVTKINGITTIKDN